MLAVAGDLQSDWMLARQNFTVRPSLKRVSSADCFYLLSAISLTVRKLADLPVRRAQPVSVSSASAIRILFPLPPLPEQHRIVAEIEKQFTRLDAGVAALKRVQANLKRYRASVLKAACEGRLASQDPADEPADRLLARILAERRGEVGGGASGQEVRRAGRAGDGWAAGVAGGVVLGNVEQASW